MRCDVMWCSVMQCVPPAALPPPAALDMLDGDCRACMRRTKATADNACGRKEG
jgi:hypothetical protein